MRLLLLAGIPDATRIAWAIAQEPRVVATASLARPGPMPVSLGIPARIGGWADDADFRTWLRREGIDAILDASHPFSTKMTARAVSAAQELGLDYLQFLRPPWLPGDEDTWTFLNDCREIEAHVSDGKRVMVDTNGYGSNQIGRLDGRRVFFRIRDRKPGLDLPEHWDLLVARRSPGVEDEVRAFRAFRIDWLVTLNAGGVEETAKLEAARRLGISVAMVRRPRLPEAPRVSSISEVLNWMRRRI